MKTTADKSTAELEDIIGPPEVLFDLPEALLVATLCGFALLFLAYVLRTMRTRFSGPSSNPEEALIAAFETELEAYRSKSMSIDSLSRYMRQLASELTADDCFRSATGSEIREKINALDSDSSFLHWLLKSLLQVEQSRFSNNASDSLAAELSSSLRSWRQP